MKIGLQESNDQKDQIIKIKRPRTSHGKDKTKKYPLAMVQFCGLSDQGHSIYGRKWLSSNEGLEGHLIKRVTVHEVRAGRKGRRLR